MADRRTIDKIQVTMQFYVSPPF